ncbi:MAG: DUF1501 domain-containing protein [Acidimicrobiales bacterium]
MTNSTSTPTLTGIIGDRVGATAMNRRTFMAAGAAVGVASAVQVRLGTRPAGAATSPTGRMVVVYLRGGQDHLSVTVPFTESAYYDQRPTIAIPDSAVLDLDGTFGFHPVMTGLHSLYQAGQVGVVVAAGNPAGNRSHFVAQDLSELGADEYPDDGQGWVARHLGGAVSGESFRAVSMGDLVASSLRGYPALAVSSLDTFGLGGRSGLTAGREDLFRMLYYGDEPIERLGHQALDAAGAASTLTGSTEVDPLRRQFADLAVLLEADLGIEVATVDIGGWDTHGPMGTASAGDMRNLLGVLDVSLSDFIADLDQRGQDDVTVVVMTEFGRRVEENGSGGTDHGWGSAMLVLGSGVVGGVHGTWPGIDPATVAPRFDVPVTTDFRDVLGEVASSVLGTDPASLFPDHTAQPVGVMV